MIIGIDASKAASAKRTGVENFVYQLILHLQSTDKNNVYFLYTNIPLPAELTRSANFIQKLNQKKRFWNSFFLPLAVFRNPCDVYLQPADKIPWTFRRKSASVVHDLAWKYFPTAYSVKEKLRQINTLDNYAAKASKLICVSKSTQSDLLKYYPELKSKTDVVALGYDQDKFHPFEHPRDLLNIGAPYLLYVGRIEERKNLIRLTKAFLKLKQKKNIPHKLVLVGVPGFNFEAINTLIKKAGNLSKEIVMPGFVDHTDLPEIIARADVFVFPSLYEGFGLAVLEAQACGAPVLTSDTSSLPEVVGDAAVLCDPEDERDIADNIYRLVSDEKLRQKYSTAGIKRAKQFSWEKTAEKVLGIMEKL